MVLEVGLTLLGAFVILLFLGVPISISLAIPTVIAMTRVYGFGVSVFSGAQSLFSNIASFTLIAIPFFVLSGIMMSHGGISLRLINFSKVLIGRLPGSLIHTNVVANMLFGSISGSATAAAASIGGVMKPLQDKEGYDPDFAAAVNVASAPTGLLIPPSNTLILYSVVSGGTSIATLFIAGYVPGILWGLSLIGYVLFTAKPGDYPEPERYTLSEGFKVFIEALPSLTLIIIVIGGIVLGLFTPTEGAAIAVLYSFILMLFYKTFHLKDVPTMLIETVKSTGIIMFLIGASAMMVHIMTIAGIPTAIANSLIGVSDNPYIVLTIIILILLFIGTWMDIAPAVLIFTPIFLPVVQSFGMDVIHFGIFITFAMCIGGITPPVGNILFVGSATSKVPIERLMKHLLPMYGVIIVVLLLVAFVPALTLTLPRLLGLM